MSQSIFIAFAALVLFYALTAIVVYFYDYGKDRPGPYNQVKVDRSSIETTKGGTTDF